MYSDRSLFLFYFLFYLQDDYNDTEALDTLDTIKTKDQSIWDWAFLGIFLGSILAICLSAWAIRISPIFFWIYGILSLIVLAMGVILSNIWQEFAIEGTFTETIANFPITNAILGTYYPLVVTLIIVIMMGLLFGKPPQE